jgi:hypothetical protein
MIVRFTKITVDGTRVEGSFDVYPPTRSPNSVVEQYTCLVDISGLDRIGVHGASPLNAIGNVAILLETFVAGKEKLGESFEWHD